MAQRTPFPPVFWIANLVEVLERFAYYGIYFSFGIYLTSLGFSRDQLGFVQTIFLLLSYCLPLFSGTLADRFGFKTMLIVSYLAYLPVDPAADPDQVVLRHRAHHALDRLRGRHLQAAGLRHRPRGDRPDQLDGRRRHLLRDGQRRRLARSGDHGPAARDLLGLRFLRGRHRASA